MAGGFSTEDAICKVLAMGSPCFKAVCMGRALMIPVMVGKNIGRWIKERNLPKAVSRYGQKPEEIFVLYVDLVEKFGKEARKIPAIRMQEPVRASAGAPGRAAGRTPTGRRRPRTRSRSRRSPGSARRFP